MHIRRQMLLVCVILMGLCVLWTSDGEPYPLTYSCMNCHGDVFFGGPTSAGHTAHLNIGLADFCYTCHDDVGDTPYTSDCIPCHLKKGLIRHHVQAAWATGNPDIGICAYCHNPVLGDPEDTMPPGYAGTCLQPCDGSEELFSSGSFTGSLDNDGDLLVDTADSDCASPFCPPFVKRQSGASYPILQEALEYASDGETLWINDSSFAENLSMDMDKTFHLQCGYCFAGLIFKTATVMGNVTLDAGALIIEDGTIEIVAPDENCDDYLDNDEDGLADCDDPDCAYLPACNATEISCTDCIDNDGDGYRDCNDTDCDGDPDCAYGTPGDHVDNINGYLHMPGRDDPVGSNCIACHGSDLNGTSFAPSCNACHFSIHTDDQGSGAMHKPGREDPVGNLCTNCHGSDLKGTILGPSCTACHTGTHTDNIGGYMHMPGGEDPVGSTCITCHGSDLNGTVVAPSCNDCHYSVHTEDVGAGIMHKPGKEDPYANGCTACHGSDLTGTAFAPSCGDCHGSHTTHINQVYGPQLTCINCHGANAPPLFADGLYLENSTVCDTCHSSNGVPDAKLYWQYPGSSEGLASSWAATEGYESYCGSCHDGSPGYNGGDAAYDVIGDNATYGFYITGHGRESVNYDRLSWQSISTAGNPAADRSCEDCHDLTSLHFGSSTDRLKVGYENDEINSNCNNCHYAGGPASANPQWYTDPSDFQASAHSGIPCTDCHDVHGMSGAHPAMTRANQESLCYNCHTNGMVQNDAISNNRSGGYNSADDIEEAFSKSEKHNLGTLFSVNGSDYYLECVSCHNVHVVTGRYWDAEEGKSPVTRFPGNTDGFPVTSVWGDTSGEKMDDFASRGSGSGGWYFSIARGGIINFDQPAVYQPPRDGSGWAYEFDGDVLPDYATFCLDCHSYRMSDANPPVNWGQGIGCTDSSVDPPDQRIECGAQHGLGAANKPSYWGDVGLYGSSGNPDPIFNESEVTRGRGAGHFMRWPYDSAYRNAGINFVMSCTDCHEAHGSNRGGIIRERFNVTSNGDCGTGGDSNPNGENCTDGGNWNSYCNACHYYYGGQHAGMSCGSASCHEANSPHRIIHVSHSAGTSLWQEPSRPDYTPEIESVEGEIGGYDLTVNFTEGVYTNMDQTGALEPADFMFTDINSDNPRYIENVTHKPGEPSAIITMSEPLTANDSMNDIIATRGISIWNGNGDPAGPWPMTMAGCPATASFQLNEPEGSPTITDESGLLIGTVGADPYITIPGTGYYHGDEDLDTYIDIDNANALMCMISPRAVTIEARIYTTEVDSDYGDGNTPASCTSDFDCDPSGAQVCSCGRDTSDNRNNRCPGDIGGCDLKSGYYYGCTSGYTEICPDAEVCCPNPGEGCWNNTGFCSVSNENATFSRIFQRQRNIMVTVLHTDYRGDNRLERAGKASIEVKYFVDSDSRHTCPHTLWPDDDYIGNDVRNHQISTDIDQWPLVANHWYKVRVVFNSDNTAGDGDDGAPVDIFLDDQGETGLDDPTELWGGYVNASQSIQDSSSCKWGAVPGDYIASENQASYIGTPPNHAATHIFDGDIDWVTWKPVADYSGVDGQP